MSKTLYVRRIGNKLVPIDELAELELAEMPSGKHLKAIITQPRSVPHMRLYHSLLTLVAANNDVFDKPALEQGVKQALGYSNVYRRKHCTMDQEEARKAASQIIIIQKSLSFEKMMQDEFNIFTELAFRFLSEEVIPGLDENTIERARSMIYDK